MYLRQTEELSFKDHVNNSLKKNIIYVSKYGRNKAFLSESYIRIVKRRLYMTLRGTLNQNWVQTLERVVINLNNTPIKKLGYLKPNMINNEADSVLVKEAKTALKVTTFKEPDYKTQQQNQIQFESSHSQLQKGNFCYVDFDEKLFDKSFDVVVRILYEEIKYMLKNSTKVLLKTKA